jgi:hypothetical protein
MGCPGVGTDVHRRRNYGVEIRRREPEEFAQQPFGLFAHFHFWITPLGAQLKFKVLALPATVSAKAMTVALLSSRELLIDLEKFLPLPQFLLFLFGFF